MSRIQRITDESQFRAFYHSAISIYSYIDNSPELSISPWGFDVATFSEDGKMTTVQFSCTSARGWGKEQLIVTATENDGDGDGDFNLSHKILHRT